jgi:ankyrin repeat domain-containing protein 17
MGHQDVVRRLLQSGAAVDTHDDLGWTPLMSASQNGHFEVVRLLLQNGANADSDYDDLWTSSSSAL